LKTTNLTSLKDQLEEEYSLFKKENVTPTEVELVKEIRKIFTDSHGDFNAKTIEDLILIRENLSRNTESLGEIIATHEMHCDYSYIWRKGKYAEDWLPMKSKLAEDLGKATTQDIDSKLTSALLQTQLYSMFHRRRADYLLRKVEASDRYIRTIDHRIAELRRQFLNNENG